MIMVYFTETVDSELWVYKTDCKGAPSLEVGGPKMKAQEAYSNCLQMEIQCASQSEDIESLSTSTKR